MRLGGWSRLSLVLLIVWPFVFLSIFNSHHHDGLNVDMFFKSLGKEPSISDILERATIAMQTVVAPESISQLEIKGFMQCQKAWGFNDDYMDICRDKQQNNTAWAIADLYNPDDKSLKDTINRVRLTHPNSNLSGTLEQFQKEANRLQIDKAIFLSKVIGITLLIWILPVIAFVLLLLSTISISLWIGGGFRKG